MTNTIGQNNFFGRNLADFLDGNGQLPVPEQQLREACARGEACEIAKIRPDEATAENTLRASFIRFLALGGDTQAPVNSSGVWLVGGWIKGALNLDFCTLPNPLQLQNCHLQQLNAREAYMPRLDLKATYVADGIKANGIKVAGNVLLTDGFTAAGLVGLLGAEIGGTLFCDGGNFHGDVRDHQTGPALSCDRAKIAGNVYLRGGFAAVGTVRLVGTKIGGTLSCRNGHFDGRDRDALSCERAVIQGSVFFRTGFTAVGTVRLRGVSIGALIDPEASWPKPGQLVLDGIKIGRIGGAAPTDGHARVRWLQLQWSSHLNQEFKPQPWEEVIRVLRSMGHPEDARIVAVAKQDQLRKAGRITGLRRDLHWAWGKLAGYGYEPLKLANWMATVWLLCGVAYMCAEKFGRFAPTNPVIHTNEMLATACTSGPGSGKLRWTACEQMPDAYTTFSPFWYSADVILPVVDLQQERDWAPAVTKNGTREEWGEAVRWLMWFEILFGWVGSLMLVAILTNLIKKD